MLENLNIMLADHTNTNISDVHADASKAVVATTTITIRIASLPTTTVTPSVQRMERNKLVDCKCGHLP